MVEVHLSALGLSLQLCSALCNRLSKLISRRTIKGITMIETYRGVVYPNQLDHMGHMNVQWYTAKFDEATWHLFASIGITSEYIKKNNKGMAAVEQNIKYKAEVMAGDLLVIKSRVIEVKAKILRFLHVMYNAETNQEVASSELVGVHIDRQERKSCLLPKSVVKKCANLIEKNNITTN